MVHYGRLLIGTEAEPFGPYRAVITLVGDRNSYELPVYGAKTIAVRAPYRTAYQSQRNMPTLSIQPWLRIN